MRSLRRRCAVGISLFVPLIIGASAFAAADAWSGDDALSADRFGAQQSHRYVVVLQLNNAGFHPRPEEIRTSTDAYARAIQAVIPRGYQVVAEFDANSSTACNGYDSCDVITVRQEPLGGRPGTMFRYLVESRAVRAPGQSHYHPSPRPVECRADIDPEAVAWSICRARKQGDFVTWFNQVEPQEHWSRR
jgi:hypothetical protein